MCGVIPCSDQTQAGGGAQFDIPEHIGMTRCPKRARGIAPLAEFVRRRLTSGFRRRSEIPLDVTGFDVCAPRCSRAHRLLAAAGVAFVAVAAVPGR